MRIEKSQDKSTLDIRPGVSVLSILRHLNYRPWYALAEFVDNSVQSYVNYRDQLEGLESSNYKLKVAIKMETTDGGLITVRDNAAGIHEIDYARAFRPAAVPPDRSGLSEFGMGMKSAACWFSNNWSVRTSALGEMVERTVTFDIERIVKDTLEELSISPVITSATHHYTELRLWNLHSIPQGRTLAKIKEHLASIYRVYMRQGILELEFNDEVLSYEEPEILIAPYFRTLNAEPVEWRKEIKFDFGMGQRATGFAALRKVASTALAGFALFRRNRLIEGSGEDTYRPTYIFGRSNEYAYQRLFGELHLEGFEVSHTKDGFRWDSYEDIFLEFLKQALDDEPLPLLKQAEGHRTRLKPDEWRKGAEVATQRTAEVIRKEVPPVLDRQTTQPLDVNPPPIELPKALAVTFRDIEVELKNQKWLVKLELSQDPSIGDWVSLSDDNSKRLGNEVRHLTVRLSLAHPFMDRFATAEPSRLEPLVRLAVAIVLAEVTAREGGVRNAGQIRRNINELLREALSRE